MSGLIVLAPQETESEEHDFKTYSAYLDDLPVIYHPQQDAEDRSVQPQPVRQDVGNNPFETRSESGDIFAQGDFSQGQGQEYFHRPSGRNPSKFLTSEGADIETPGKLKHLSRILLAAGVSSPAALEVVGDELFVTDGNTVKRTSNFTLFTSEDPHAGEGAVPVLDMAAAGAEMFVALGANGLHRRTSGAIYGHYRPDGATNLDTGDTRVVRWLRSRPWVIGDAGRSLYEVLNDSTPDRLGDRLPEGWTGTDIFQSGPYIFMPAVNKQAGLSQIFHYRLKEDASGFEPRGSSIEFPGDQLFYVGRAALGQVYLGGGKKNDSGGFDPVVYRANVSSEGFISLEEKIAEGSGAGALDLSIRSITLLGETLLFGWSLGVGHDYGSREGIAIHYPARAAFAHHHAYATDITTPKSPLALRSYKGRVVWVTSSGLYYEDPAALRPTTRVISSIGDWSTPSPKIWDRLEVLTTPLESGTAVDVYYTLEHPDQNNWELAGSHSSPGSTRASFLLDDVTSSVLAVKLESRANSSATSAPQIIGFSVRSNPAPEAEWIHIRTVRVAALQQKSEDSDYVRDEDPNETVTTLKRLLHRSIVLHEQPGSYRVQVKGVSIRFVGEPQYAGTEGEPEKNHFDVQMIFQGTDEIAGAGEIRVV
jgi:hypothetical protein